jgi:serine phosphatase RsbU (regulator of sigma subunit)
VANPEGPNSEALLEAVRLLRPTLTADEIAEAVARVGRQVLGADWAGVAMWDPPEQRQELRVITVGPEGATIPPKLGLDEEGPTTAAAVGESVFLGDPDSLRERFPVLADRILGGDESAWAAVPVRSADEVIGVLRFAFAAPRTLSGSECDFVHELAAECAIGLMRSERFHAHQAALIALERGLRTKSLPEINGWEIAAQTRPAPGGAAQVGGDWFDAIELGSDGALLAIGDVMGHGPGAASDMGQLRIGLRALALTERDPGALLSRLDELHFGTDSLDRFATLLLLLVPAGEGEALIASAGHLPPLLVRDSGEWEILPISVGPPIGVPAPAYETYTVPLRRGDLLFAVTDGVIERPGQVIPSATDPALIEVVERIVAAAHGDLTELVGTTLAQAGTNDDATVVAVRRN